jgi:phospholipid/cholesterol/gamma-HCH transport system ATP-binding protein
LRYSRKELPLDVAIEMQGVSLSFGRETFLENINVKVARGESLVLIGPSGKGKTLLLKLMAGLIKPTRGEILVGGANWHTMKRNTREKIARKTGMLFQKNALFDSLTVADNVAFPLREVAFAPEKEIDEVVAFFLEAVGIAHARDLFPDEISGGMQKRLGIARALALKPEIVFYDDPTAGLDPITSRRIVQLIIDLRVAKIDNPMTIVAVTNDMNRAEQMATRIAMVVDRTVIECGSPAEIKKHKDPRVQQFIHGDLLGPLTRTL